MGIKMDDVESKGEGKKMRRVAVFGGAGFIGAHLGRYLKDRGYWVRVVDKKYHRYMRNDAYCDDFTLGDLRNANVAKSAIRGVTEVYNLAADMGGIGFIKTKFARVMYNNITINKNVIKACIEGEVDKLFFSSSACVYPQYVQDKTGIVPQLKESEVLPAEPDSYYGYEKLFTELMLNAFRRDYPDFNFRIARFHNIQGIYTNWYNIRAKAPAALCRKVAMLPKEGGEIEVWGDGKQVRTFLNIKDCCEAVYRLMRLRDSKYYSLVSEDSMIPPALNIGSTEEITIDDLVDMIAEIAEKKVIKRHDISKPQGVRSRSANISLALNLLNWKPKYSLKQTMEEVYKFVSKRVKVEVL